MQSRRHIFKKILTVDGEDTIITQKTRSFMFFFSPSVSVLRASESLVQCPIDVFNITCWCACFHMASGFPPLSSFNADTMGKQNFCHGLLIFFIIIVE